MSKYQFSIWAIILALVVATPGVSNAAFNTASIIADTPITVGSIALTISGTTAIVESLTVSTGSVGVVLKGGSFITLKSTDRYRFTTNTSSSYASTECTSTYSAITLTVPSGTDNTVNVTVTPDSTTTCASTNTNTSSSGGGGGGGGGGGAPYVAPIIPTTPAIVPGCPVGMKCTPAVVAKPSIVGVSPTFTKRLVQGNTSADVTRLQTLLASDPVVYPEGKVTGYFGPLTRKAVENFQIKYKIAGPGVEGFGTVGPMTRAQIQKVFGK